MSIFDQMTLPELRKLANSSLPNSDAARLEIGKRFRTNLTILRLERNQVMNSSKKQLKPLKKSDSDEA